MVIGEDLGTVAPGSARRSPTTASSATGWLVRGGAARSRSRGSRWRPSRRTTCRPWPGAYGGASGDLDLERLAPVVGDRDPAVALYEHVASSPALLACAALDDVVGATVQPNVPGTVDEFPNWRVPLPLPLESIPGDPHAQAVLRRDPRPGREEPARASNVRPDGSLG